MPARYPNSTITRLALARLFSYAGSEAAFIALIALVYQRTQSTTWVSLALLATIGTGVLLSPLSGAIGDRFDRRRVMVCSDLAAAACYAALPLLHEPGHLLAMVVVAAAVQSPFAPASKASIPQLVPPGDLVRANARLVSFGTIGHLIGPAVGGVLVATIGAGAAFGANAATFVISAALVFGARGDYSAPRGALARSGSMLAGYAFVRSDRVLRILVGGWACMCLGFGLALACEYPLAEAFGVGSVGYGLLGTCWGLGCLVGAFLAPRLMRRRPGATLLVGAALLDVVWFGVTGAAPSWAVVLAAMALAGIGLGIAEIVDETMSQSRAPEHIRSRTMAAAEAIVVAALGAGLALAPVLEAWLGPQHTYFVASGCLVAGAIVFARLGGSGAPGTAGPAGVTALEVVEDIAFPARAHVSMPASPAAQVPSTPT